MTVQRPDKVTVYNVNRQKRNMCCNVGTKMEVEARISENQEHVCSAGRPWDLLLWAGIISDVSKT